MNQVIAIVISLYLALGLVYFIAAFGVLDPPEKKALFIFPGMLFIHGFKLILLWPIEVAKDYMKYKKFMKGSRAHEEEEAEVLRSGPAKPARSTWLK